VRSESGDVSPESVGVSTSVDEEEADAEYERDGGVAGESLIC
jgi:hypothetical protein